MLLGSTRLAEQEQRVGNCVDSVQKHCAFVSFLRMCNLWSCPKAADLLCWCMVTTACASNRIYQLQHGRQAAKSGAVPVRLELLYWTINQSCCMPRKSAKHSKILKTKFYLQERKREHMLENSAVWHFDSQLQRKFTSLGCPLGSGHLIWTYTFWYTSVLGLLGMHVDSGRFSGRIMASYLYKFAKKTVLKVPFRPGLHYKALLV